MHTEVYEFWLKGEDGYNRMPVNAASEIAHTTCWDKCVTGNAKPGKFRRSFYVEGHAKPIHKRVVKRYK